MLSEVIELQTNAVLEIVSQLEFKNKITFKAPTGSEKTYMMADLMDRVLEKEKDVVFLVSSLSTAGLAEQNYDKFMQYSERGSFKNINPYLITSETSGENALYIPTDYNVYVLPVDLYKKDSKLKQGALLNFLRTLTMKIDTIGLNKKIYLIKDECHRATNNIDELADEFFSKILNFTATPKLARNQQPDVVLDEVQAINTHLIKNVEYCDIEEDIDTALNRYKEIKKQYLDNVGINPCFIIQVSNKIKGESEIDAIKSVLKDKHKDLKWMLIVNQDNKCDTNDIIKDKNIPISKWKDYAKNNDSTIDIIIFKMVIKEGWDIPRACMLYQVRQTHSEQLDEQVIGRIRRNPRLLDFEKLPVESQKLISTAYVWGVKPKEQNQIYEVSLFGDKWKNEIQNEIKLKTTRLKEFSQVSNFDINEFLNNQKENQNLSNIFALYKKYEKANNEVKSMYEKYVTSPQKWFKFTKNIEDIKKKTRELSCNYEENMELATDNFGYDLEVSFPLTSFYTENVKYEGLDNWVWKRTDGKDVFSFDSEAEKEWAKILLKLINEDAPTSNGRLVKNIEYIEDSEQIKKYLIGKNFLVNSEIKYEYYLDGKHSSYPDFIMKDYKDRIHIFETKSVNKSSSIQLNEDDYHEKITELISAYKTASKLTGYNFYIPIKEDGNWKIRHISNGEMQIINTQEFVKFIKS